MSTTDEDTETVAPLPDTVPEPYTLDNDRALIVAVHDDERTLTTRSLEEYLPSPLRARGHAEVARAEDFAAYVNRLADPVHTTVWADLDACTFAAVLNDHASAETPGWRDHAVSLHLTVDRDWTQWAAMTGKSLTHTGFAEHLDALADTIIAPDAATVLDTVRSLHGTRTASFRSTTAPEGDRVGVQYEQQARAGKSGELDVPASFVVRITPWVDLDPTDVEVKVSYRVENDGLTVIYRMPKLARAKRDTFAALVTDMASQVTPPIYVGAQPRPINPHL